MAEAPLHGGPATPVPPGALAEWIQGAGGARLRAAWFPASGAARGSVVLSPGRTEPIEKYFEVIARLTGDGLVVLAHDWRGQGLSQRLLADPLLGHAVGADPFVADFSAVLAAYAPRLPRPWIALGHSMGGCLTLLALARGESRFAGALLSAPMLGIRTGAIPPRIGRALAATLRLAGRGATAVRAGGGAQVAFAENILTHDPARYARNLAQIAAAPELALGPLTWGWLDFAFSAVAELRRGRGATRIAAPVTVVAAGDDRLVDNAGSRAIAARIPGARYIEVPGAYHELMQETDALQAPFWAAFEDLRARVGA